MTHTVLVVDDEPSILRIVEDRKAEDGEQALELFERVQPSIVVLDLMLPKIDGFRVCQLIKEQSDVPIIILSVRGDEYDKIVGFRMGVDDYLTKPFSPRELALRVQAILRRTSPQKQAEKAHDVLQYGELQIDYRRRSVHIADKRIELTAKEFDLLWVLAANPDFVFTREQLLYQVWNSDYEGDVNNVTVLVSRLREKLEPDPSNPRYIETVWGVGYRFKSPV